MVTAGVSAVGSMPVREGWVGGALSPPAAAQVKTMRVLKKAKFIELKEQVHVEMGAPLPLQRYWIWAKRQNHTYRPNRYLTEVEDAKTMEELQKQVNVVAKSTIGNLNLYLEECLDADGRPQVRVLASPSLLLPVYPIVSPRRTFTDRRVRACVCVGSIMKKSNSSKGYRSHQANSGLTGPGITVCSPDAGGVHACILVGGVQPLPLLNKGDTLLFFKYYDAVRGELRYVGKLFANQNSKFSEIHEDMCAMANLPPDEELLLFEVNKTPFLSTDIASPNHPPPHGASCE